MMRINSTDIPAAPMVVGQIAALDSLPPDKRGGKAGDAIGDMLRELTAFCEQGFEEVLGGFAKRLVRDAEIATQFSYPRSKSDAVYVFDTLVNGRVKEEGGPLTTVPSVHQAEREFREEWAEYRAAHPGDVLCWRVRPELETRRDFTTGTEGHCIRARVAILPWVRAAAKAET